MSFTDMRSLIQVHLQQLIEQVESAHAAIAVTTDGHLVTKAERKEVPAKRLAAMGSTLMSLGDTITKELEMGPCRNVISENEDGVVIFMHLTKKTVLICVAESASSLGMLLSASRHCIEKIRQEITTTSKEGVSQDG